MIVIPGHDLSEAESGSPESRSVHLYEIPGSIELRSLAPE
jgi:hypothetical protein